MFEIILEQLPKPSQDEESECRLLQLPQELIDLIISYLPMPWALSLSLTCKPLHAAVQGLGIVLAKRDPREFKHRGEFLSTLQKDLPGYYFCYCCFKLRRLIQDADWDHQPHKWTPGPFHPRSWWLSEQNNVWHVPMPYQYPTFKSHFHIDFMEVYLIMNTHFLGPSHGIPLKTMERFVAFQDQIELNICQPSGSHGSHPGDHPRSRHGLCGISQRKPEVFPRLEGLWRFTHQIVPRIVDDKLYVARFYRISGPLVPWQCLARLISSLEPEVCRHTWCSAASSPPFCNLIPLARNNNDTQRSLPGNGLYMVPLGASSESDSCTACHTDYDISLTQDKDNREWVFSLRAYHCLGACRSPRDDLWSWFTHDFPLRLGEAAVRQHDRFRRASKLSRHAGTARRKWIEGGERQVVCRGGKEHETVSLLDE